VGFETLVESASFLEWAFLKWVLNPAAATSLAGSVVAQQPVVAGERTYRLDYEIAGAQLAVAVELDGFAYHSSRDAFTYDRLRQNDLAALGRTVVRFTYDSIRTDTARCVAQLQAVLARDPQLAAHLVANPVVAVPDDMEPDPLFALTRSPAAPPVPPSPSGFFETARHAINRDALRLCQREAFTALSNYYGSGGRNAATVMSVGAGKTVLGVLSAVAFTTTRALIVTPASVIRGTFDKALDPQAVGNSLYGLPCGPLLPGHRAPVTLTLDRADGSIRAVTREQLLAADIIVTNFHSLGTGDDPDDLLAKLGPDDIDMIVIDEAHIAASESYQRLFRRFPDGKTLLMSACFQRVDGKPIDADVVYRYRLIDSIVDGNAKNLRVHRFAPDPAATTYQAVWPDGAREQIIGRDSLLEVIGNERKLANITAKSDEPIRQVMRLVRQLLDSQAELLHPVKPRVLFSALGARHAEQLATIAEEQGIPCASLHHTQSEAHIRQVRQRFESDNGDLQGIVQLKMLGQGYDFPAIGVVVPMRPYGSFSEFYQFIGRGIRVIQHPSLVGRVAPADQFLDVVYHAEMDLDAHVETIYLENDMDPVTLDELPDAGDSIIAGSDADVGAEDVGAQMYPDAFVLFEQGTIEERVIHDQDRVEAVRDERERAALMQRYAEYAATTASPLTFEQFVDVVREFRE
jgi:superfamily II DNA or RNA helicase/very-short-patch-repair endonuclease